MSLYDQFKEVIDGILAEYKKVVADGKISISEVFTVVGKATATFVELFRSVDLGDEAERKDAVVMAIGRFYDEVIAPIDITGIPSFLEPIVDKALRELLLLLCRSWVDSLVAIFTKNEIIVQQRAALTLNAESQCANLKPDGSCDAATCCKQVSSVVDTHEVQRIVAANKANVVIY